MRPLRPLLVALALALTAAPAFAQQAYRSNTGPYGADFSGVELGADLGLGLGSAGGSYTSGPAAGLHIGYNFQANSVVGGVEADALGGSISNGGGAFSYSQDFLSSLRAKGGYAFGDILGYGTIGFGWATTRYQDLSGNADSTVKGVVYGLGAEYALTRNVSIRGEVIRYDFGAATYNTPSAAGISSSTNMVRIGASVHF